MCITDPTPIGGTAATPGRKGETVWLPRADMEIAMVQGYARVSDLTPVPADQVALEVHTKRPIGIVARYMSFGDGLKAIKKLDFDPLVHASLLMDQTRLAKKFRIHRSAVHLWTQHKTFPEPKLRLGDKDIFYLPEVLAWLKERRKGKFRPKKRRVM